MHLLHAVVMQRRALHWLVPLVSLWVAIVFGLAFSGALVAQAEGSAPLPALSSEKARARFRTYSVPFSLSRNAIDAAVPQELLGFELIAFRSLVIDGDPGLPAGDLLPARGVMTPPERRLFVEANCHTPMSLMLHSSFGPERMQQLAREILVRGLKTTNRQGNCGGRRKPGRTTRPLFARNNRNSAPADGMLLNVIPSSFKVNRWSKLSGPIRPK